MDQDKIIYLDNAASTIPHKSVKEAYIDCLNTYYANPSANHRLGAQEAYLISQCKEELCRLLNLSNKEIIYTSGATEANNLAIRGYALKYQNRGKHLVTSSIEHPSVLLVFEDLEKNYGFSVTYVKPNKDGVITCQAVKDALRDDTILVSIMGVNNETGAINEINQIGSMLKSYPKINFHVDNVQGFLKLTNEFKFDNIDLMVIGGHKIYGLIGSGLLFKRKNLDINPILIGGGQENNFRSGTSDLPNLIALKSAIEFSYKNKIEHYEKVKMLSDRFKSFILSKNDDFKLNSHSENPYIVNFSTLRKKASVVVEALSNKGIMVSSKSACHSSKEKGSYVIFEMTNDNNLAMNTIRVSFGYQNTIEEIDALCSSLEEIVAGIRQW